MLKYIAKFVSCTEFPETNTKCGIIINFSELTIAESRMMYIFYFLNDPEYILNTSYPMNLC